MSTPIILEACVATIESAIAAGEAGADRLELCNMLGAGGITPSIGFIQKVLDKVPIPVHVLIRPREGDFLYSDDEIEIMIADIRACREMGVAGVVTGILKENGSIDIDKCKRLVSEAGPMAVIFHRAFDLASDAFTSLEEIIQLKCARILTSGQRASAIHGAGFISGLIKQAGSRIIIMPGGGIDDMNISQLRKMTTATEFHLSARMLKQSRMRYRNEFVIMSSEGVDEYALEVFDADMFRKVRENANR